MPIPRSPFSSAGATARFAAALGSAWLLVACGGSSTTLADPSAGGTSGVGGSGASATGGVDSLAGASSSSQAGATSDGGNGCNQPTITTPTPRNGHYPATTVSSLRNAKAPGCFELSHVGLVARTDSPSEPRIYLQDPGGGDSSAILAKCTASATHACAPEVKAKIPLLFDTLTDGAQLSVRGYYQFGSVTGFEEFYIEDIIDECKTVARPAPIALSLSDLTRDARAPAKWFRRVMLDIPATDPLVVYDFSPPELLLGAAQCPDYAGFAMIQHSLGALPPAACSGTSNPAPRTTADPKEVLIGRQFFNQFLFGADCACAGQTNLQIVKPTGAVSGPVLGYLILEQDKASPTAYQVFKPAADQTFPIR